MTRVRIDFSAFTTTKPEKSSSPVLRSDHSQGITSSWLECPTKSSYKIFRRRRKSSRRTSVPKFASAYNSCFFIPTSKRRFSTVPLDGYIDVARRRGNGFYSRTKFVPIKVLLKGNCTTEFFQLSYYFYFYICWFQHLGPFFLKK
jgi:hypothetical protein